jgi:hypothetical protein
LFPVSLNFGSKLDRFELLPHRVKTSKPGAALRIGHCHLGLAIRCRTIQTATQISQLFSQAGAIPRSLLPADKITDQRAFRAFDDSSLFFQPRGPARVSI